MAKLRHNIRRPKWFEFLWHIGLNKIVRTHTIDVRTQEWVGIYTKCRWECDTGNCPLSQPQLELVVKVWSFAVCGKLPILGKRIASCSRLGKEPIGSRLRRVKAIKFRVVGPQALRLATAKCERRNRRSEEIKHPGSARRRRRLMTAG